MTKRYVKRAVAMLCASVLAIGGLYIQTEAKTGNAIEDAGLFYDCDSADGVTLTTWSNDVSVTTAKGEYKEGIGALKSTRNIDNNADGWFRIVKDTPVDLSAYKDGGISFLLYVSEANFSKLNNSIGIEISSSGKNDADEYEWERKITDLQAGWNKVELFFDSTYNTSGTPDLSRINFMRIFYKGNNAKKDSVDCLDVDFAVFLDDIRGIGIKSESVVKQYTSTKDNPIVAGTAPGDTPVGYLFAGWYTAQKCESENALSGTAAENSQVYAKFVPEEIQNVKTQLSTEEHIKKTVVSDCDDEDNIKNIWCSQVVTGESYSDYIKEGSGALYCEGQDQVRALIQFTNPFDFSAENTKLHFWLYISEISYVNSDLMVEINSNGQDDKEEKEYVVDKGTLKTGWNEIALSMTDGEDKTDPGYGDIDLTQIRYLRVYFASNNVSSAELITSIDDIYIYAMQGKILLDCDNTADLLSGVKTLETNNVKEGMGSFKAASEQVRFYGRFAPTNIDEYKEGRLHFWLYIEDVTKLTKDLQVELTSSGNCDKNELGWTITPSFLKSGWNNINLPLQSGNNASVNDIVRAVNPVPCGGDIDYTAVNFMRILFGSGGTTSYTVPMYIDDIRVVPKDIKKIADLRFVTTVDTLNYKNVGFELKIGEKTKAYTSKYVYETITGVDSQGEVITYTPSADFSPWSRYFYTRTITNIPSSAFGTEITVTPFWTTQDGTVVKGVARTNTVNEILE